VLDGLDLQSELLKEMAMNNKQENDGVILEGIETARVEETIAPSK
jgi:hypothetical protein